MDIHVLHTEWADGWGGQEIRILNEMLAMREAGINVMIACTSHSNINHHARANNIPTFNFPFTGNYDLKTLLGLRTLIKDQKIDIVNTHSSKDTLVGGIAAKLAGAKFIRTRHLSVINKKTSIMNRIADYVITTGESVRKNMILHTKVNPDKIKSIPTGIDPDRFNPSYFDRKAQREQLGLKDDDIVIGMVAVLRGWKRHDRLLECAKKLVDLGYNIKVVLAGDGPNKKGTEKQIIENELSDRVTMLGYVKNPETVLPAFDFVMSCSDGKEGVSQSVMQALLMEKVVLATDVGSITDLYHNDNFILLENGKVDDWVLTLKDLIDHPEKQKIYQTKARGYVLEHFSKQAMVKQILDIYYHLLKKKETSLRQ
ncbi:glycosyltransferase [Thiotrichales bacterium 19S9-12]|nr:glycosyltransferase [Thiotrichales bacterium 19S9-11]MCF6811118.1 glycosyltransferase [Thiotrichales bacterium 19S9-12]